MCYFFQNVPAIVSSIPTLLEHQFSFNMIFHIIQYGTPFYQGSFFLVIPFHCIHPHIPFSLQNAALVVQVGVQ